MRNTLPCSVSFHRCFTGSSTAGGVPTPPAARQNVECGQFRDQSQLGAPGWSGEREGEEEASVLLQKGLGQGHFTSYVFPLQAHENGIF